MSKGIIAAGNWIVDQIKTIDRWPGEGNLCNILQQEMAGGGGPCNVLFDLAAMTDSIPLYAAGKVGNDAAGDWLLSEIRKRQINATWMSRSSTRPTSFTDVMSGEGKRTFFHNRGANAELDVKDFIDVTVDAKIFYLGYLLLLDKLDSADPQFITRGAKLLAMMRSLKMLTVVDFVSEAPEKFQRIVKAALPYIDVLVINEIEAGNAFDVKIRLENDTLDMAAMHFVAQKFISSGIHKLFIIHYPEGAYACTSNGDEIQMITPPVSEIVGSNGAGDAFCAGILYGLHENWSLDNMLKLASASAAFNLKSPSASGGAVSLGRLQKYMSEF